MKIGVGLLLCSLYVLAKTYTVQEVVSLSIDNSKKIDIASLAHSIQYKEVAKSKSFFYPTAYVELTYDKQVLFNDNRIKKQNEKVEGTFNIEQVLYDRSKYLEYEKEKHNFFLTQLDENNEKNKLVLEVIQTYLETLFKKKQIYLIEYKKNHINKIVQKAKLEYEQGFISKAEYQESLSQKYELQVSELERKLEYENLKTKLGIFTSVENIDVYNNIKISSSKLQQFKYFENALEDNYEVQTIYTQIKQSKVDKSIAYSKFEPTVKLNYEYLDVDLAKGDGTNNFSVVLNIPLFEGFSKYNNLDQTLLKEKQKQEQLEDIKLDQYEKLKKSYLKLTTYQEILALYPGIIDAKELRLVALSEEFSSGIKSLVELLDETNKYFEKYNKYVEYKYLYLSELASLHYETNKLDEQFITTLNGYIYGK